ncbi:hypothetical protein Ddye_023989 [Dipteronia dyeriana]|uniref:Uncharacterized protein n=1 Tax=Dipteronia dyeriana TaxID=168575 RepID=A0AAD9WT56_9ROSI|nr:hypothetical protein Ddye_023989 [Dipteronia dyeriana]
MGGVVSQCFERYYMSTTVKRNGKGTAIVWFMNDLRIYCVKLDFHRTWSCHFTVSILVFFNLLTIFVSQKLEVYAQRETYSKEVNVENMVRKKLRELVLSSSSSSSLPSKDEFLNPNSSKSPMLQLIWSTTMYHLYDIPFNSSSMSDMYTQFCKASFYSMVTNSILTDTCDYELPCVRYLGNFLMLIQVYKGMKFVGGENAVVGRVFKYFWKKVFTRMKLIRRWLFLGRLRVCFVYFQMTMKPIFTHGFDVTELLGIDGSFGIVNSTATGSLNNGRSISS